MCVIWPQLKQVIFFLSPPHFSGEATALHHVVNTHVGIKILCALITSQLTKCYLFVSLCYVDGKGL